MIEIILLVVLCRRIGANASAKGLGPGKYKFFVVLAWFGGEILGALFAYAVCLVTFRGDEDFLPLLYLGAIFTASLGVWFVFKFVAIQPDYHAINSLYDELDDLPLGRAESDRVRPMSDQIQDRGPSRS